MKLKTIAMSVVSLATSLSLCVSVGASDLYITNKGASDSCVVDKGVMDLYVTDESATEKGNITYATGVTPEMSEPSFWAGRTYADANKVMLSPSDIDDWNEIALHTDGTNMYDLEQQWDEYNATSLKNTLASEAIPTGNYYIREVKIDSESYFGGIKNAIDTTGYEGTRNVQYGVCVKSAPIKSWPTNDIVGDEINDTDDELQTSALTVNEPFVIKMRIVCNEHTYYWGYSNLVSGWVDADCIAICNDRDEWIDSWKVENGEKNFLVVTQDKIVLEPSLFTPYSSEVKLKFATILKLVDKDDIPKNIGERNAWNNYVVYLPTRNSEGMYEKKMALISEHCDVSVGFLPMTQANIIKVSLACLGNRYGWGGMLDSMDCSLFTRNVYRCFGFEIPRNTTWQQLVPGSWTDLSGMDDEAKQSFLETMPAGTMLYFRGHTMIYLGSVDHVGYVVSDLGNTSDSVGELEILSIQNVAITPLTVRRAKGQTWLHDLSGAVAFAVPVPEETTEQITTDQATTEEATTESGKDVTTVAPTTEKATKDSEDVKLIRTKITKIKAKKKSLKISWKRIRGVSGYKLQIATNKKFKKAKVINVKETKVSKTVKGLKKKKTYFVRIRTYIVEKFKNKETIYYSDWSKALRKKTN